MRILLLTLVFAGCMTAAPTESSPPNGVDDFYNVSGTVVAIDLEPMSYDADAEVSVQREDGQVVVVYIPARINLCQADLSGFADLEVGDQVEVVAQTRGEGGSARPCVEASESFRRR